MTGTHKILPMLFEAATSPVGAQAFVCTIFTSTNNYGDYGVQRIHSDADAASMF